MYEDNISYCSGDIFPTGFCEIIDAITSIQYIGTTGNVIMADKGTDRRA